MLFPFLQSVSDLAVGLGLISTLFNEMVLIILALIVLAFMFGKSTSRHDWVAMAKIEFAELLKSVVLFAFILAFYSFVNLFSHYMFDTLFPGYLPKNADLIDSTVILLRDASSALQNKYVLLAEMAHQMKLFSDASSKVGPGTLHVKTPLFVGSDLLLQTVELLLFTCLTGLHSLTSQIIIFDIAKLLTIYLFFPVGLFLRLIPTTREAGNELISIGITVSIILPTLYLFMYFITFDIINQHSPEGWENPIYSRVIGGGHWYDNVLNFFKGIYKSVLKFASMSTPFLVYIPYHFLQEIQGIAWLLFFSLAIPTFAVTLAVSLVKSITAFLDLDIALTFVG